MEGGTVGHILKWDYPRTIPAKFSLFGSAVSEKKI
jgi:hypothetical protein